MRACEPRRDERRNHHRLTGDDGACYFAATNISPTARRNRGILAGALTWAGMVNYPTEWWHWSYGDRYWALATSTEHAIFGPAPTPILEETVWREP